MTFRTRVTAVFVTIIVAFFAAPSVSQTSPPAPEASAF